MADDDGTIERDELELRVADRDGDSFTARMWPNKTWPYLLTVAVNGETVGLSAEAVAALRDLLAELADRG